MTLARVLLFIALACFVIDAFGWAPRVRWVSVGLAFLTASLLVGGLHVTLEAG